MSRHLKAGPAPYGLLLANPAHEAALPRLRQSEMQILEENQVSLFLIASTTSNYWALYHLDVYGHLMNTAQSEAARFMDELVTPVRVDMSSQVHQEAGQGRG